MPHDLLNAGALLLSAMLLPPVIILAVECVAGSLRSRNPKRTGGRRPSAAILVPAHNEELQITETLSNIRSQMRDTDRLIVVADNCSDMTAAYAREAGAEVVQREDALRRGKGYALDAGVKHITEAPPEVVLVIDADCWLEPGALDELVSLSSATNRPVQSCYLMIAPPNAAIHPAVSEFAFLLKNRIRFLGLSRLGLPVQMTGSGMAFPWLVLRDADLANGNLVEDMKLGLELARDGHAPLYCDAAVVKSRFPYSARGVNSQASRWSAGRFALARSLLSALINAGTFRNRAYLALVLDALVPPLALLATLLLVALVLAAALAATNSATLPLLVSATSFLIFAVSVAMAWYVHGRQVLPLRSLIELPQYVLTKMTRYPADILGSRKGLWIRTDRKRPTGA